MADRFVKKYSQGVFDVIEILVDTETGVNYIFRANGESGGMTVLLDSNGKPVIDESTQGFDFSDKERGN